VGFIEVLVGVVDVGNALEADLLLGNGWGHDGGLEARRVR
jgi:hypothetical protein